MAHFAEIDTQTTRQLPVYGGGTTPANTVLRVLVVPDEQEQRGAEYLAADCGLGGAWVQCSYSGSICKRFPGAGYLWLPDAAVFAPPQPAPFPSRVLDTSGYDWTPPIAKPDDGKLYRWDEASVSWVEFTLPAPPSATESATETEPPPATEPATAASPPEGAA